MAFFGASALINATGGAAVGGAFGYMNTGDWQGALGGAAAGAAFGGLGGGQFANKLTRGAIARVGSFGKGGQMMNRAGYLEGMGNRLMGHAASKGYGANSLTANTGRKLGEMGQWIGKNRVAVNKWGSRAATAAGLGAASYIGSSIISSNNGY